MPDLEVEMKKEESATISSGVDQELEEMFRAGVHFGYSRTRRHPKMRPYIFGLRNNIEVFDLERVREKIREAEAFLKELAASRGILLLVGTKPAISGLVKKSAEELEMPYVVNRWSGGLFTNFSEIRKRLDHLKGLKDKRTSGELAKYTKKEQLEFSEEIEHLERKFSGVVSLKKIPDALLIVDPREERTATREALQLGIKSVGITNIDCNPDEVTLPIPANDSAPSSVKYILEKLVAAYKEGTKLAKAENGES